MFFKVGDYTTKINIKTDKFINITYDPPLDFLEDHEKEGVIVFNNLVTKTLTDFITMTDEELSKHSNLTIPSDYRKQLIRALHNLWD